MSKFEPKTKILFQLTGSIACYKACNVISKLVQNGYEVKVAASTAALQFVGAATLEGLTGQEVISDLWAHGHAMDHINWNRWADLIIVAPATANFINKISHGIGDDLLSTMFLAHDFKKPYLISPAMNTMMYQHPITSESVGKLLQMGVKVLETASGVLACGEEGSGKLLDPELIYQEIETALKPVPEMPAVLITSGGTQEKIDSVRVITNKSSGSTAATIADHLIGLGYQVTYLHAESAILPKLNCDKISFLDFKGLEGSIHQLLGSQNYSAMIHAAAVSDFSVEQTFAENKIPSDQDISLKLKRNPKLVNQLREFSKNKNLKIIAFKMTADESLEKQQAAVEKLYKSSNADFIVQNDLSEINWKTGRHSFHLYEGKTLTENLGSKTELAQKIAEIL